MDNAIYLRKNYNWKKKNTDFDHVSRKSRDAKNT